MKSKLKHEWITVYNVEICQCCGISKDKASTTCPALYRIITKGGKLKVTRRKG